MSPILGIWASAGTNTSFDSIATVTVGSGGSASVSFTSIPTTYTHLQIRTIARFTSNNGFTAATMRLQFNGDTANNYFWHQIQGTGSSALAAAATTIDYVALDQPASSTANTNVFGVGVTDILDYRNTNKNKTIRNLSGTDNNGDGFIFLRSGAWNSTSAITSILIYPQPGVGNFAQYSHFALYGIRSK